LVNIEYLFTIAEVAVALAGFSALVGIVGRRVGRSDPRIDAFRLQLMLEASLFVAALALFPVLPRKFGASPGAASRVSCIVLLVVDIPLTLFTFRRAIPLRSLYRRGDPTTERILWVLGLGADVLAVVGAPGFFAHQVEALYSAALFLNLILAGVLFIRFAASTFMPDEPAA
jgi:hypothetical protein